MSWIDILFSSITPTNLGELSKPGTVLKLPRQVDSQTVPGFYNWPRFVGVIEQNKISNPDKC